jgi:hypothetical protein
MLNNDRNLDPFDRASIMEHIVGSMIFENLPTDLASFIKESTIRAIVRQGC